MRNLGFLGPRGTFTEEALVSQDDLAALERVPFPSMPDALAAVERGEVDAAFVPIENAIEGTVSLTMDALVFDHDLLIQREVITRIQLNLLAASGVAMDKLQRILTFPVAWGQCREWLAAHLPTAEFEATNSTADAARRVAESGAGSGAAAIGPALAATVYGLEVLAEDVEDHPDNATRFVLVSAAGIPAPTGHDKTSIVCFQRADAPGSLHAILGQFSARGINLTKLESRPTKRGLGNYCFIIDLEGHVADEVVADCLRDLHASLAAVKFLGSYPAAGEHGAGDPPRRGGIVAGRRRRGSPRCGRPYATRDRLNPWSGGRVWSIALALKASSPNGLGGSNPSRSAHWPRRSSPAWRCCGCLHPSVGRLHLRTDESQLSAGLHCPAPGEVRERPNRTHC